MCTQVEIVDRWSSLQTNYTGSYSNNSSPPKMASSKQGGAGMDDYFRQTFEDKLLV